MKARLHLLLMALATLGTLQANAFTCTGTGRSGCSYKVTWERSYLVVKRNNCPDANQDGQSRIPIVQDDRDQSGMEITVTTYASVRSDIAPNGFGTLQFQPERGSGRSGDTYEPSLVRIVCY